MFWVKTGLLFFVALPILAEDKWIWNDNARNANDDHQTRESKLSRYEIFEDNDEDYTGFPGSALGDYGRPIRPPHRPYPVNRPGVGPGINPYPVEPIGPHHPGNDLGGRPPFKKFDTCTCSERFNCKSPGISYGHCDVGKSYCCFNRHGGIELEPAPSRPIHSPENGVLVGPDGAGGGYGRPGRPGYGGRPSYGGGHGFVRPGNGPGVLVGPGGPSGLVGRPIGGLGGRPIHSPENGVLVGPGGPYDRPGYGRPGLYGRSAGSDERE